MIFKKEDWKSYGLYGIGGLIALNICYLFVPPTISHLEGSLFYVGAYLIVMVCHDCLIYLFKKLKEWRKK